MEPIKKVYNINIEHTHLSVCQSEMITVGSLSAYRFLEHFLTYEHHWDLLHIPTIHVDWAIIVGSTTLFLANVIHTFTLKKVARATKNGFLNA